MNFEVRRTSECAGAHGREPGKEIARNFVFQTMAMASALPWVTPASHLNFFNCSIRRPALLSPFSHAPNFLRNYHISRARRISPLLCRILRHGDSSRSVVGGCREVGFLWCRELGFGSREWAKGGKLPFPAKSSNKNLNADTSSKDEVVSFPVRENFRVISRNEEEDEDSDSDDEEEDGIYYDEEDEFSDVDGEFEDNEEDAEAGVVLKVPSEGGERSGKDRERLKELCAKVQASGERTVTARDIADLYDFPFDKFQVCTRMLGCVESEVYLFV